MEKALVTAAPGSTADHLAEEMLCLLLGTGLTFALFFGIARVENAGPASVPPVIEDLHQASAVFDPPPPKVEERAAPPETDIPLTGIDVGASESPVKLSVVPPDLEKIMALEKLPPAATIQFGQIITDLRPKIDIGGDFQHIYQQSEVDVAPKAMVQAIARVPSLIRNDAEQLRVTLVLVIDTDGAVTSIRVTIPSGNAKFDEIVKECVRDEWQFSPAIRKGKKVRCMVQQLVWYKWTSGSPFTVYAH